jgi:Bacterial Ig-like domain (group 1)/PKD domain
MLSLLLLPLALVAACDKVPLLAPTGSVINLFPVTTTVTPNSEVQIIATVIENGVASGGSGGPSGGGTTTRTGAGTPVQNGTLVTFTTTIGRIEPSEARTHNGQVTVKLIIGNASGTATITAYSGGASSQMSLKVGTAAVSRISVTTTPQSLGSSGGSVLVQATVTDEGGNPLSGVPVTFSTDKGSISPSTATSDSNGIATATLTTTATAKVTAVSGAATAATATVTVSPFGLSGFSANPSATTSGTPVTFTVTPNTNANIQNVRVNFGDGRTTDLGAISAPTTTSNLYCEPGTYNATATVTDASGGSGSLSTNVIIGALPVTLSSSGSGTVNTPVTFTVGGLGSAQVSSFTWTFSDTGSTSTTSPQNSHTFTSRGLKTVRVDVHGISGCVIGSASISLDIN